MNADFFEFPVANSDGVSFDWAGETVVGKVRLVNEDSFAGRPGVFVVADGMGGHEAGDVASRIVVARFMAAITDTPIDFGELDRVVTRANADVRGEAIATGRGSMGATLVGLVWVLHKGAPYLAVVNVGDSRCYLSDDDGFRCVTHDHSLVQDLVDSGAISTEEAQHHPDRNVVTRAMGVDKEVVADYVLLPAQGQQRLLLCSDGVSAQLSDDEVMRALTRPDTPAAAVRAMIDAVMSGKALDNATAVVVDVIWAAELPETVVDVNITSPRPLHPSLYTSPFDGGSTQASPPVVEPAAERPPLITAVPRATGSDQRRRRR